jgi:hypothetical protein
VPRDDTTAISDGYEDALRQKYHQYRDAQFAHLLVFDVERLLGWTAAESARDQVEPR